MWILLHYRDSQQVVQHLASHECDEDTTILTVDSQSSQFDQSLSVYVSTHTNRLNGGTPRVRALPADITDQEQFGSLIPLDVSGSDLVGSRNLVISIVSMNNVVRSSRNPRYCAPTTRARARSFPWDTVKIDFFFLRSIAYGNWRDPASSGEKSLHLITRLNKLYGQGDRLTRLSKFDGYLSNGIPDTN